MAQSESQKRYYARKLLEYESMPKVPCECGCGTMLVAINKNHKPARFAHGHNVVANDFNRSSIAGKPSWNKGIASPETSERFKGKPLSPELVAKQADARKASLEAGREVKRGWKHPPETLARMKEAAEKRRKFGEDNHFYGRKHSEETRKILSEKLSGENHPFWQGGIGLLPYGPEFTRKFRAVIRNRDGNMCQRCAVTREEYGRTLPVHHMDHNKLNNDPANLATTCHSCNLWHSWHRNEPFVRYDDVVLWAPSE